MLELLFLLLPVAAAYGWFMGRNSVRSEERKEQQRFSKQYATGLNLLLSDQPDKAVDLFVELLDVDSETDKKEEDNKDEKEVKTKTISSDLA